MEIWSYDSPSTSAITSRKTLTFGEGCVSKVYAELPEDHWAVISACASCPSSFQAANPKWLEHLPRPIPSLHTCSPHMPVSQWSQPSGKPCPPPTRLINTVLRVKVRWRKQSSKQTCRLVVGLQKVWWGVILWERGGGGSSTASWLGIRKDTRVWDIALPPLTPPHTFCNLGNYLWRSPAKGSHLGDGGLHLFIKQHHQAKKCEKLSWLILNLQ